MEYTQNKDQLDELLQAKFEPAIIFQARKMIELGRVSLSFMKGTYDTYIIVSGIIA